MTKKRELEETTSTEETNTITTTTTEEPEVEKDAVEIKKKQKLEEPIVAEEKKEEEKKEEEKKEEEKKEEEKKETSTTEENKEEEKKEEEAKPAPTSFFGFNSSSPFSFSSSPFSFNLNSTSTFTNAFGKPPSSTTNGDSTNNESGEKTETTESTPTASEDFTKSFTPIFAHVQTVEVKTGEEDDSTLCSAKAKLFAVSGQEYKERGVGLLKLNKNTEGKSRLIMIADGSKRSLLNANIFSKMSVESPNDKSIKFVAYEEGKITTFFVRMAKADEIKTFIDKINQQIKYLQEKEHSEI
ncbi:hypothetical protein CYY_006129 [Polysphondylium violaceum]|uniref:RanBD1 domain-containing protein n=1 Tax=Polysphondylium violaceum TaxID=133409 RepID=A0A8J4V684_9MYCE|nr:hypothetical protein CYY_006129 [Polysphondylium violaceum]